ncbi:MAG: histidine triad nucleotide-binding protein [Clostridiaceae bacterium]
MEDCIFCKIVNGEIPAKKIYEDEKIICFEDLNKIAKVHVLIVPKMHINSLNEVGEEEKEIISYIFEKAKDIAKILKVYDSGYRIITNCGEDAGQTVKHIHFHLIGGEILNWS